MPRKRRSLTRRSIRSGCLPYLVCLLKEGGRSRSPRAPDGWESQNTQFGGPRAASKLIAPHGETWLPFPPQSENITERAPGQEGLRGVGGWVQTSCEDRQTQTVLNKHTQRAARLLPLESPARKCSGSKFSARRYQRGSSRRAQCRP